MELFAKIVKAFQLLYVRLVAELASEEVIL